LKHHGLVIQFVGYCFIFIFVEFLFLYSVNDSLFAFFIIDSKSIRNEISILTGMVH